MIHNNPPFAIKIAIPAGPLDAALARRVLGDDYHWGAAYFSDGKYVRRIVTEEEAREECLTFYFDGEPCRNGHIAPRKLRRGRSETQCMECRRLARRRSRQLKEQQHEAA